MLKWNSESEYFLSFEKKICRLYSPYIPVQEQSLNLFAAHARRGVIIYNHVSEKLLATACH